MPALVASSWIVHSIVPVLPATERGCDDLRAFGVQGLRRRLPGRRQVGVDEPVARGVPGPHRQSPRGEAEALGAGVTVHPGSEILHACDVEPGEYLAEDLVLIQVRHAD